MHIVPRCVHRVRYGGLFHGKGRTARLDQCRKLLIEYNEKNDIHYDSSSAASSTPASTPPATTTRAIIAITQRVIAMYALSWTTLEDWSQYFRKNVRIKKEIRGIE